MSGLNDPGPGDSLPASIDSGAGKATLESGYKPTQHCEASAWRGNLFCSRVAQTRALIRSG